MTLTITDYLMTSDHTGHTCRPAPGHQPAWQVSWLPGRLLNRNSAITAMIFADTAATPGLDPGHRIWPHLQGWAAELGLTAPDAIARASEPPEKEQANSAPTPADPRLRPDGQPVVEHGGGQLLYDAEPRTAYGRLVPNPEEGTVETEAFHRMDEYARREVERVAEEDERDAEYARQQADRNAEPEAGQ